MSRAWLGLLSAAALLLSGCATEVSTLQMQTDADNGIYEVAGAVRHPGTFHLPPNEFVPLSRAIRRAGGPWPGDSYNDGGDLSSVHVTRLVHGSSTEYTLDCSPGGHGETFPVRPGDYVQVPKMAYSTNVPIPAPYSN